MTDIDFEDVTDEQGQELPQTIQLNPDAIINQLMRRYSGQLQQQTWENTLLATENESLKTMLAEAKQEKADTDETIVQLSRENDYWHEQLDKISERALRAESLARELQSIRELKATDEVSPADDPQPTDAFLAAASGQPGLASTPAPAES